ncbi:MAG: hypothetical protein JXR19_06695 [Bacteroidia bacterium]
MQRFHALFVVLIVFTSCRDNCRNVVCAPCPACPNTIQFNFDLDSFNMGYSLKELDSIEIVKINRNNSERIDSVSFGFNNNTYESISNCSGGPSFGIGPNTFNDDEYWSFNYEIKPAIGNSFIVEDIQYDWLFSGGCCDCGSITDFQVSINDSTYTDIHYITLIKN